MKHLYIDFRKTVGSIKPVNGVNNGPLTCNFSQDARPFFKKAGIPFSRLHDTEYPLGSGEFVDVSCLFKNFNADENDPSNYNFTLTDEYLKAIDECGTRIIYRLGATIEHQPVKVHTIPPKDYLKWARVCEHIILHYNEGWANGLHLGIEYWEIWNEPELGPLCWGGTREEFCRFYITVVRHLKNRFPGLKFGGPGSCGPWTSFPRLFLETLRGESEPVALDFFSWHGYPTDPDTAVKGAHLVDDLLKEFGYTKTENIYDEWNYVRDWNNITESHKVISSVKGAAFDAAMMIALQHSPCSIATYYDAQTKFAHEWCGLFDYSTQTVHGAAGIVQTLKPYYAFEAFGELARLGSEAESSIEGGSVYACAAVNGENKAVLIANYHHIECASERIRVVFDGMNDYRMGVYRLDRRHDLERVGEIANNSVLTISADSVVLLKSEA